MREENPENPAFKFYFSFISYSHQLAQQPCNSYCFKTLYNLNFLNIKCYDYIVLEIAKK